MGLVNKLASYLAVLYIAGELEVTWLLRLLYVYLHAYVYNMTHSYILV